MAGDCFVYRQPAKSVASGRLNWIQLMFRKHGADPAMIETVGSAGNSNLSTPESDLDLLIRAKPGITPAEYSHLTNTGPLVLQELQEVLGEELQYKIDLWYKRWEKKDRR